MYIEQYLSFIVVTFLVMLSPGPAVLHAINNGIKHGVKVSSVAVIGNVSALLFLVTISSIGLGAILVASDLLFSTLKLIGALYLFYLGIKFWFFSSLTDMGNGAVEGTRSGYSLFREAFIVTATNPKALAYVTALLPQFLNTNESLVSQLVLLGFTIAFIQFAVLMSYVWFSSRAKPWLKRSVVQNLFNKITGTAFIDFGVALGVSEN